MLVHVIVFVLVLVAVTDDIIYGGVGVQPAVLQQCDNHQSHQPKWLHSGSSGSIKHCINMF